MEFSPPKRISKTSQERSKWFTVKTSLSPEKNEAEEKPVLILKPFSSVPHLSFNKVKLGCTKTCHLYIHNPLDVDQVIQIEKFPVDKGFSIEDENFFIKAGEEKAVKIIWEPVKALSCRETVAFRSSTGNKSHAYLLGTAYSPLKKVSQQISKCKSKNNKKKNSPKSVIKSSAGKIESCSQPLKISEGRKENFDFLNFKDVSFTPIPENSFKLPHAFEPRASFCLKADSEFPDSPIRRQTYTINSMLLNGRESEILPFHQAEISDDKRLEKGSSQSQRNFCGKPFSLQNSVYKNENPFVVKTGNGDRLNDSLENAKCQARKDTYVYFNDRMTNLEEITFSRLEVTSSNYYDNSAHIHRQYDKSSLSFADQDFSIASLKKESCEDSSLLSLEHYVQNKRDAEDSTEKNFQLKQKGLFMEIPFDSSDISLDPSKKIMKHSRFSVLTKPSFKKTQSSPFKAKSIKSKFLSSNESGVKNLSVSTKSGVKSHGKSSRFMPKKLCLNLPKMTESVVYHRNPFASTNTYYDEHWIEKQEAAFTSWLNFILTPNEDFESENMKVDSAKLWIESIKCTSVMPAPSNEELSLKAYTATRNLNALRKLSFNLYQSEEIVPVLKKIEKEVDLKRLNIRKDCAIHADLGIKKNILEMLLSYNPLWLRIGLETVYGEVISLQNNSDVLGLSRFIVHRFLQNPEIASKFSLPSVINYYKKGYEDEIQRFILKKFLLLVFFLDTAKNVHLIKHNPCLFNKNAKYKSSRDLLLAFSREYLGGEGDITKHLRYLGYKVCYKQTTLEEFDFSVRNLATDLRCGLRLGRVVEILLQDWTIFQKLRINTLNRLTKVHNNDVILKSLKDGAIEIENNIEAKHITDGDREKTLDLLWQIIFKTQISKLLDKDLLKKENDFLCRSLKWRKDFAAYNALRKPGCVSTEQVFGVLESKLYKENEILQLLFQWCQIVCTHYDVKVHNFTSSFSDGRVLCLLLHHYHPNVLPYESIKTETSCSYFAQQLETSESDDNCPFLTKNGQKNTLMDTLLKNEKDNLRLVFQKFKEVGNIPILSTPSDLSNTMPDEKVMITLVSYINIRLMELSIEVRAARKILHAWRSYKLRKQHQRLEIEIRAVRTIQRAWRKFLDKRRLETENKAAIIIQSYWRMHHAKRQLKTLREQMQTKNAIIIQAAFRGFCVRRYIAKCHNAAVVIQVYFRQWYIRSQFIKLRNAAIIIQQNYRAKIKGRSQKLLYDTIRQHIIKLQAYARGMLVRRYIEKQKMSAVKIQAYIRMWLEQRKYNKMQNACITIQRKFRGYLLTEYYSQEYQNHRNAAILVQRWYRSVKIRQYQNKCIVKIQAFVRMHLARKKYLTLRQDIIKIQTWWRATSVGKKVRSHYIQCYRSIICIQSFIRQCSAKRKYNRLKKSTLIIQKYARAFMAQRKLKKLKESAITIQRIWRLKCLTKKTRLEYLLYRDKVILAQSVVRQFIAVQRFNKQKHSAIVIQKNFRAFQLRKHFQLLKLSVISIQRKWRAVILGRQVRSTFLLYRKRIIFLQSIFRMQIAVRQFRKKKKSAVVIQKYARARMARNNFLRLKKSSVIIQSAWRNILLGRNVRNYFLTCQKSAIKIQSIYRMYSCKKNFILLKKSVATIEQYRLGKLQREKYLNTRKKVIKLQSVFRCLICRENYIKSVRNITLVQACSRKFVQRKKYLQIRMFVLKIQSYYRAYQMMCSERQNYMAIKKGMIKFQALYRGWHVRKSMKYLHLKATLIQCFYRRWKAQSDYKKLKKYCLIVQEKYKAKLEMKKQHSEFVKIKKAVVTIQAFTRCHIARIHYKRIRSSVIKIQSYVRMTKSYKLYHNMKEAAVTIQQFYRSYKIMRQIQDDYIQKRSSIILLQSKIRMLIMRKRFLKQKKACIFIQSLIRKHIQQKKYIKIRRAAIFIQRFYRNQCVMKTQKTKYIQLKKAAICTQSHFRSIIARKKFLEQKKACILIQSYVRMHHQYKEYNRILNAVVFIQQHYRNQKVMKIERNKYLHTRKAVILLQSVVRSFIERKKFLQRKKACITIQSAVRMHIQKKEYLRTRNAAVSIQRYLRNQLVMKAQRNIYIQQRKAVILLQSVVRSFIERKKFLQRKKACITIQSAVRMHIQKKEYLRTRNAAVSIQRYIRNQLVMKAQRNIYIQQRKAVILLQSVVRSFIERKKFLQRKKACITIQSAVRMHIQKKEYLRTRNAAVSIQRYLRNQLVMKAQRNIYIQQRKAIILLQSRVRSAIAQKKFLKQKNASILIQSNVRMYIQQKKYKKTYQAAVILQKYYRCTKLMKTQRTDYLHKRQAAIILQSAFRSFLARKKYMRLKYSCIKIQAFFRMLHDRNRFSKVKNAVICIQKHFRSWKLMKVQKDLYSEKKKAIIFLQSQIRSFLVKKNFENQKRSCIVIQSYVRMYMASKRYNKVRRAAIVLQKWYHLWKLTKLHQKNFIRIRNSVIYLQSKFRCMIVRRQFLKQKQACIVIQSFMRMFICKVKYGKVRKAALVIQKYFRNYQISTEVRNNYLSLRTSSVIIQSYFRMYKCHKEFISLRSSVIIIQKKYRAVLEGQKVKQSFLQQKNSCIKIQSFVRMFLAIKKYTKVRNASITIQSKYRTYIARKRYIQLKKSVITIQKYFMSWKITKAVRSRFLLLRSSAIVIQSAIRSYHAKKSFKLYRSACIKIQAFVRKYLCQKAYAEKRNATLILQKHFRAYLLCNKVKGEFVYKRKCIVTMQAFARGFVTRCRLRKRHSSATKIQSIYRAYVVRQHYLKEKKSAIIIQRYFRSLLLMRNTQQEYINLKKSAVIIQSHFRKYKERKAFLKKKAAVIALQTQARMFIARSKFNRVKKSVHVIEKYYLAYKIGLKEYQLYQKKKDSCLKIQAAWRGYSVRKRLKNTTEATIKIQRAFRLWKERRICMNMGCLVLNQANLPDALKQRLWYLSLRRSTIDFQRAARAYLLKRDRAATVIQSYFRMKKVQQQYKRSKAAIKIQACWRAYNVRRSITDAKVFEIQKKIKAADSSESNTLKNRTTRSLELLFKDSLLESMLLALQELDVCTRLSPKCCESLVASGGLAILVQLVRFCNRSIPHMELIKLTTNILLNLSKYEKTVDFVWAENGSIDIILKLMKIFREKGTAIFTKCCSLLWIFCQDPDKAKIMKQHEKFTEQICSFHYLLTRKQSVEVKRFVSKAIASKSFNTKVTSRKDMSVCVRESLKIDPDWILGRQRQKEFEDPIVAITSVMKSLGINGKA